MNTQLPKYRVTKILSNNPGLVHSYYVSCIVSARDYLKMVFLFFFLVNMGVTRLNFLSYTISNAFFTIFLFFNKISCMKAMLQET